MSFKLKEFEGKELLKEHNIKIPNSTLVEDLEDLKNTSKGVVKIQTLSGKRAKNKGIKICNSKEEIKNYSQSVLGKKILNEKIKELLIEEKIDYEKEYYFALIFNTIDKCPQLLISKEGGSNIEENSHTTFKKNINPLLGIQDNLFNDLEKLNFEDIIKLKETILNLHKCFEKNDLKLLEINPLVYSNEEYIALDCVAIIDSEALKRHKFNFPERIGFRKPTDLELKAKEIDKDDYRGVAGKTFLELDGDIAILASGGGASVVCMDALLKYNGKPANYTEYSGNPSQEKVKKLATLTLSKKGLNGLWIVGGTANFTDIKATFQGLIDAFKEINPQYPIVIRRAGPNDKEAFQLMEEESKKNNWNVHLFNEETPMTLTAETIVSLSQEYKNKNGNTN
ncbi:hypothetical protein CL617_03540 [archaeon]|nr:hypothetical protein [archaeon]|tara:strand:+ start:352 stop:1539 length:1188 start_codon:yes stop_codon:yes gene_type:complete